MNLHDILGWLYQRRQPTMAGYRRADRAAKPLAPFSRKLPYHPGVYIVKTQIRWTILVDDDIGY